MSISLTLHVSDTVSVQRWKKSARDDGEQREHERKENARRVSDREKSDVHGLVPATASIWIELGDFINRDGALSVSEKGFCVILFSLPEVNNLESFAESKQTASWMEAALRELSIGLNVVF